MHGLYRTTRLYYAMCECDFTTSSLATHAHCLSCSVIHVPRVKTDFGRRAFSSAAVQIWNHIPTAIFKSHRHLTSNVTRKRTILPLHNFLTTYSD